MVFVPYAVLCLAPTAGRAEFEGGRRTERRGVAGISAVDIAGDGALLPALLAARVDLRVDMVANALARSWR